MAILLVVQASDSASPLVRLRSVLSVASNVCQMLSPRQLGMNAAHDRNQSLNGKFHAIYDACGLESVALCFASIFVSEGSRKAASGAPAS